MKKIITIITLTVLTLASTAMAQESFSSFLNKQVNNVQEWDIHKANGELTQDEFSSLVRGLNSLVEAKFLTCKALNNTRTCTKELEKAQIDLSESIHSQAVDPTAGFTVLGMATKKLIEIQHGVER